MRITPIYYYLFILIKIGRQKQKKKYGVLHTV